MRWRWASICQLLLLLSSITIEANEDNNANNENDNANNEDDTEDGGDKDSNVTMGDGDIKEAESNKTTMGCEVSIMCLLLAKRCPIMTLISNISPGTNWTQWNS